MPSSRYSDYSYSTTTYGNPPSGYRNSQEPWAFGSIRVDAIEISTPLASIVPGQSVTYRCWFYPDPCEPEEGHIQRWRSLADYLVYANNVVVYDPPGADNVFYYEQYDGPSSLLRIAPLSPHHDATWEDGDPPPSRDSVKRARWAVAVGGEARATEPDHRVVVDFEAVTIAAADPASAAPSYQTRDAVLAAAERKGPT